MQDGHDGCVFKFQLVVLVTHQRYNLANFICKYMIAFTIVNSIIVPVLNIVQIWISSFFALLKSTGTTVTAYSIDQMFVFVRLLLLYQDINRYYWLKQWNFVGNGDDLIVSRLSIDVSKQWNSDKSQIPSDFCIEYETVLFCFTHGETILLSRACLDMQIK